MLPQVASLCVSQLSQTADDSTRSLNMASILEVVHDANLPSLVEKYNATHGSGLRMRGRATVVMPGAFVRSLFEKVFKKIRTHVQDLLDTRPVQTIFLVGGFAESALLQDLIKTNFASARCSVVVPVRPGTAVLRGAVKFGKNQDVRLRLRRRVSMRADAAWPSVAGVCLSTRSVHLRVRYNAQTRPEHPEASRAPNNLSQQERQDGLVG
jgi:hypothetical protein